MMSDIEALRAELKELEAAWKAASYTADAAWTTVRSAEYTADDAWNKVRTIRKKIAELKETDDE